MTRSARRRSSTRMTKRERGVRRDSTIRSSEVVVFFWISPNPISCHVSRFQPLPAAMTADSLPLSLVELQRCFRVIFVPRATSWNPVQPPRKVRVHTRVTGDNLDDGVQPHTGGSPRSHSTDWPTWPDLLGYSRYSQRFHT
jgi:hypothetical protein